MSRIKVKAPLKRLAGVAVIAATVACLLVAFERRTASDRTGVPPPVPVRPISIAHVITLPDDVRFDDGELMGLAVRAFVDQPDTYIARMITRYQHQQASMEFHGPSSPRSQSRTSEIAIEGRLTDYQVLRGRPTNYRLALPVFFVDARTGTVKAASQDQWNASTPPSTFVWYPFAGAVFDRLSYKKGWELSNIGINRMPIPAVLGVRHRGKHLSLDRQFIAVTTGDDERRLPFGDQTKATGRTFVNFIDVATAQRIDPVFELLDAPDVDAFGVQLTWTPDNRYMLGVHASGDPATTYRRLWIVPFEHGRSRAVGPWDHVYYVDESPSNRNSEGFVVERSNPPISAFKRQVVPEAWRSAAVPSVENRPADAGSP